MFWVIAVDVILDCIFCINHEKALLARMFYFYLVIQHSVLCKIVNHRSYTVSGRRGDRVTERLFLCLFVCLFVRVELEVKMDGYPDFRQSSAN